jgi:hypothetical protein
MSDRETRREKPLRPISYEGLTNLSESALRDRIALAFVRMGDFQRSTSHGYRRAEEICNEAWAELDRRGLPRV